MKLQPESYGLEEYIANRGINNNMYRSETFGQPGTLVPGDILASGHQIVDNSSDAGNGGVELNFTDGTKRIVAARIPLLLDGGSAGKYPLDMQIGDIFETGDVVLAVPYEIDTAESHAEAGRGEVQISITGGLSGHSFGVPKDLIIALHSESYPPSTETRFGSFVIDNLLNMGASARRNLPFNGRLDQQLEADRLADVFGRISTLATIAHSEQAAYQKTIDLLHEQCKELKGTELLITGQLHGRGGTRVYDDNPLSQVKDMLIEVTSATVNTYQGLGTYIKQYQPFIEIYGKTVDGDESVGAWIDVGKFGVSVIIPNASPDEE